MPFLAASALNPSRRARRARRWLLLLAAVGLSAYGAFKVYHLPTVSRRRRKIARLAGALTSIVEAASTSADTFALIYADLVRFLRSESKDVPASLQQIVKLTLSPEFSASVSRVSEALTTGIVRGFSSGGNVEAGESGCPISSVTVLDNILDKLFSGAGADFAAAITGSFASNLALNFSTRGSGGRSNEGFPSWLALLRDDNKCRDLAVDCVERAMSAAVAAYLGRSTGKNSCDELFAGLTNPKHEGKVRDILVAVCNGVVETLVKSLHEVMTETGKEKKERALTETARSTLGFLAWKMLAAGREGDSVIHGEARERGLQVLWYAGAKSMVIITVCFTLCMQIAIAAKFLSS